MSRWSSRFAEIGQRCHQTCTEVMLPDTIDNDAGGQRMVRSGQPASQRQTSTRRFGFFPGTIDYVRRFAIRQDRKNSRPHFSTCRQIVSSLQQIRGGRITSRPQSSDLRLWPTARF